MKTLPGPLFLFLWLQLDCVSRGEKVEQHPSFLSVQEGESAVIHCTYTDSASTYFYWYKQQPGAGLQLLMQIFSSMEKKQDQRFTVLLRDARAQTVTQPDRQVTVSEGTSLELTCNYSYGGAFYLFWYVQHPSQGLQLLLRYISGDTVVQGIKGFEAEVKKSESSFNLRKYSVHWSDTAEYFCALAATVPGAAGGAEHKLYKIIGRRTASGGFWILT
ncbi:T-cell receptor alpha chain V region PHDS58 [Sciurus carolinensis]|nr:T-cell receptor alpha chain V region PHDS58 [Sciurus carolinensis]